jgi:dUTP pyrophosphatase
MELKYKKLRPNAKTPLKIIEEDAGFDLYAISYKETRDFIEYQTGIAFEIPKGYVGLLFPRSSVTKYDLMLKNSVGVIDSTFRGEVVARFAKVINDMYQDSVGLERPRGFFGFLKRLNLVHYIDIIVPNRKIKKYNIDDRVVQIVFLKLPEITLIEAQELSDTERGEGGFGSSGK